MKLKKLLLLILSIICVLSFSLLTACGGEEIEEGGESSVVITLADTDVYLELGEEGKINYTVSGATDTTTKWKSDDESICSVDSGKIVGLKEGNTTVSLTIDGETVTANVTVFTYQSEKADVYTTPVEVYDYYYEGRVIANDFVLNFAEYGMVYNKNAKAKFVKGNTELNAAVRASSDKSKLFVSLEVLGAKYYGEGYSLIVSSADKMVEIPIDTIVTKFISEKDDLHYLFYFGNMEFNTEYCVYDGYFVQTTDIDMECIPLLNRLPYENHLPDEIAIDKDNPDITGPIQTGRSGETILYTYFNVDAGFMGIYDGDGYSISNVSMYDDQGGLPKSRQPIGGLFGNIGREGVVKNLGITATDTWVWYSYGAGFLLGYNINGTLENVYAKITPTLYVPNETDANPSTNFSMAKCFSGATLNNVVFELVIPDEMMRPYNPDDIKSSKGKGNFKRAYICMYEYPGFDAAFAQQFHVTHWKQTNTFNNCYFFYTSGSEYGTYSMEGFECYTYDNMPNKTFDIMEDSTYFELAPNGVPTFIGLA